ncbi:citrate lyase subunit alpha [Klebsiella michiganensis]|nr:citrate lyase subunit alpha [Klebsiella michiganensis]
MITCVTRVSAADHEELQQRAELLTGKPDPIAFTDRVVAVVRYRDGSVMMSFIRLKAPVKRAEEKGMSEVMISQRRPLSRQTVTAEEMVLAWNGRC